MKERKRSNQNVFFLTVLSFVMACLLIFGVKIDVLAADSNVTPTITSYGMEGENLVVRWKMPEGIDCESVTVYRCKNSNGSAATKVDTITDNSDCYIEYNPPKGAFFYYKIVGTYRNSIGTPVDTNPAITGKCGNPLDNVQLLSVTAGNSHSITIKWKQNLDCTGYHIVRSESPNGEFKHVKTFEYDSASDTRWWWDDDLEPLSYTESNLELGKTYYYKVVPYVYYNGIYYDGEYSNCLGAQVTINGTKVKSASSKKKRINTITWAKNDEADGYIVYYSKKEDGSYTKLKTFTSRNSLSYTHTKLTNGTAYYYKIQAYKNFNGTKLYGPMTAYEKYCDYYSYASESYESRCRRAFGKSYYADYKSAKQAKKHMKTITVKVWDKKGKKKYTRKFRITVNKGLAPSVKEMFKEIYKSKERFPIHEIGCYSWRGKNSSSEHCEGLAFDINSNENYMIQGKKVLAGSFWKPKKNRYSIPLNCKLVKILEKYGFDRGLWGSRRDYMHFSYFGG